MSKDGILIAILNIDINKRQLLIHPNVTTRGFVLVNENADLILSISKKIEAIATKYLQSNVNQDSVLLY